MRTINKSLLKKSLLIGVIALAAAGATVALAHDGGMRGRPFAHLQGVWMTQIVIRDCTSGAAMLGPFPGLLTFHEDGTISEIGPALPNSTRSPGHGTWHALGRNEFSEHLIFMRFDLSGVFLGTQVITANPEVAKDSMSYNAPNGTFEVKDRQGVTIATGCSSATAVRFL